MSGFPHSEICGSKVAHTSPQLIAACHVLHRLYAPRHPRIALTSRLRAHTTNNNAGPGSRGSRPLGIALSRYIGAGDYSQPNRLVNCRASSLDTGRLAASRASLKADTFTASILRTHSQCQTRSWNSFLNPAGAGISCLHLSGTKEWWSLSGSNRRPDACKATALPAELKPLTHSARRQSQQSLS